MTPERWQLIDRLFQTAADLNPQDRQHYLDRECAGDAALLEEIESLLAQSQTKLGRIDAAVQAEAARVTRAASWLEGKRVGHYRIVRLVGEGGMGAVYEADREDDQFRKRVALKLVRRGMQTEQVRLRFINERQILATLDHPSIARLLDGGDWCEHPGEAPWPYLVMEFVEGDNITQYCEEKHLSTQDRLRLFLQILPAVSFAHQKLIIHRDLKPSNILVTPGGVPHLLDFGIAKLLDEGLREELALRTATAMQMMTPDYAAPEQIRGEAVGTVTDVYSLGLVLFEVLTGKRAQAIENYSTAEIYHTVCERETPLPSLAAPERRGLAGDVDQIVAKAVRKEPSRRYSSVEQFADDIRRHLDGLPVLARKDTAVYRAGKFIRRNAWAVVLSSLLILALLAGTIATTIQARRAERRFSALREISNQFLFEFHDDLAKLPGTTAVREKLVRAAVKYLDGLARESGGNSELLTEVATAYTRVGDVQGYPTRENLGHTAEAEASYRKAISILASVRGGDTALRNQIAAKNRLSELLQFEGKQKEALELGRQAADDAKRLSRGVAENAEVAAKSEARLGDLLFSEGKLEEALRQYEQSVVLRREAAQAGGRDRRLALASGNSSVGLAASHLGDLQKALAGYREHFSIASTESQKTPLDPAWRRHLVIGYQNLGNMYGAASEPNLGDTSKAREYYNQMLELTKSASAADVRDVFARQNLVRAYTRLAESYKTENPGRSLEYLGQAQQASTTLPRTSGTALSLLNVALTEAEVLRNLQKWDDAERAIERCESILGDFRSRAAGNSTPEQAIAEVGAARGELELARGNPAQARPRFDRALQLALKDASASPADLVVVTALSGAYDRMARVSKDGEAVDWRRKQLAVWTEWNQKRTRNPFSDRKQAEAERLLEASRVH